jgi:hypothetical protein
MRKIVPTIMASLMFVACGNSTTAPIAVTERGIIHVSGGIGEDEAAKLRALQSSFNLKLLFTLIEGNYLADVGVVITDAASHKLIDHTAQGPFFMAKLPAGRYIVDATYEGKTVSRRVTLSNGRLHTEHFRWPSNPEVDFVAFHS